jgi:hypothetical protein
VPRARAALLLLGQRQQVETGEKRGKVGQVARVRLSIAAADEGVGRDGPATAELRFRFPDKASAINRANGGAPAAVPISVNRQCESSTWIGRRSIIKVTPTADRAVSAE